MKLRKILALVLLLGANAQLFAQAGAESLVACPDGKCEIEDQATLEEKLREAEASGQNLFCVDIDKYGKKPFIAKISWTEDERIPGRRGGYTRKSVHKEEIKTIEAKGEHSIDVVISESLAWLELLDEKGRHFYRTLLRPGMCKRLAVTLHIDLEDELSKYIAELDEKGVSSTEIQYIRELLKKPSMSYQSRITIEDDGEKHISQYAQNK